MTTQQKPKRKRQAASDNTCADCRGKGWFPPKTKDAWAETCAVCGGAGKLTPAVLGRLLGIRTRDIRRVLAVQPTHRVGMRVLDRIIARYPLAVA